MKNRMSFTVLLLLTLTSTMSFAQQYRDHNRGPGRRDHRPSTIERIREAQRIVEETQRLFQRDLERNQRRFSNEGRYENGYDTEMYGHARTRYGTCGETGYVAVRRTMAGTYACFPIFKTGQVVGTAVDPYCCN